jgi:hypothetical protein
MSATIPTRRTQVSKYVSRAVAAQWLETDTREIDRCIAAGALQSVSLRGHVFVYWPDLVRWLQVLLREIRKKSSCNSGVPSRKRDASRFLRRAPGVGRALSSDSQFLEGTHNG